MSNDKRDIHNYNVGTVNREPAQDDHRRAGIYVAGYARRTNRTKARRVEACRELLEMLGLVPDKDQPETGPTE